ncbi:hypothetical protein AMYX_13380 [Anaeromyxobacter diazotrophicus]|uniref:DUF4760 domain-containing protein n=1 Tax=Anaeromyxobacter diazotrophicus TaxID=2590199 RepID=A0A7I9VKS0_9BACT|nr:hypothetical protein AMYX_13380 [Anaeromyxobacter diazotrophicus]
MFVAIAALLSAIGTVAAGGAAVVALITWQHQRRSDRRSDVAVRALAALHTCCELVERLLTVSELYDSEGLDYATRLPSVIEEYDAMLRPVEKELELRGVELRLLRVSDAGVLMATRDCSQEVYINLRQYCTQLDDLKDLGLIPEPARRDLKRARERAASFEGLRARADHVLGPVARYEETSPVVLWWRRMQEEIKKGP